eukprot:2032237-Amphidinium_carterae.1
MGVDTRPPTRYDNKERDRELVQPLGPTSNGPSRASNGRDTEVLPSTQCEKLVSNLINQDEACWYASFEGATTKWKKQHTLSYNKKHEARKQSSNKQQHQELSRALPAFRL